MTREFISLIGGAATWPLTAPCAAAWSCLPSGSLDNASILLQYAAGTSFKDQRNRATSKAENVVIEHHSAEGQYRSRSPALAADRVRRQVAVIVATALAAGVGSQSCDHNNSDPSLPPQLPGTMVSLPASADPVATSTGVEPADWANWCESASSCCATCHLTQPVIAGSSTPDNPECLNKISQFGDEKQRVPIGRRNYRAEGWCA